jgi:dihydroorotase
MSSKPLVIKGGQVFDSAISISGPADVLVEDSLIKSVDRPSSFDGLKDAKVLDATDLWVFPGLIDMHVHLRTPGQEYKEDLTTGLKAAAAGGYTSVLAMPNTDPPVDNPEIVRSLIGRAQYVKGARLLQSAAMTRARKGEELNEYHEIKEAGAVAVSDDGSWVTDSSVMRRVLDYASVCGLLPLSHPEDGTLSRGGVIHEGWVSTRLGLRGIPPQAEELAIYRDIALSRLTGKPVHICHVSTGTGADLIRRAKQMGIPVSAETTPHHLTLTHEAVLGYNTNAKMNPPLRLQEDNNALLRALQDGTIDAVATDHAPHSILEKETEFALASVGVIGLETAVSVILELMEAQGLSPLFITEMMSLNPARLLGLPLGLKVGNPADISIVDPQLEFIYTAENGLSKSRNTPYEGRAFKGRAVYTIVGGEIVHEWKKANPSKKRGQA